MTSIDDPVTHYDRITQAWQFLLGEDFHFGYFHTANDSLEIATENLTALMAESGAIGPDMSVLDVGCGIGNPACSIAERYGCRITGITTSRSGVEGAQQRARARNLTQRVTFAIADGMDNGFPDASFDRVWVLESSHLMPRKEALIEECARVVRPGGRVVLCDVMLGRELPLREILGRAQDFIHLHYAFGRAKMETLETYRQIGERAGLQVTQAIDISRQTLPTFALWQGRLEKHRDEVRALIGEEGLQHFLASCEILPALWAEQVLGYGLVVAIKA
jgi:27-O-demethylrifamycin SV methyltransferase